MGLKRRNDLDFEHRRARDRKLDDNRIPVPEQNAGLHRDELDEAWRDWLAAERLRRGNPDWRPRFGR